VQCIALTVLSALQSSLPLIDSKNEAVVPMSGISGDRAGSHDTGGREPCLRQTLGSNGLDTIEALVQDVSSEVTAQV
jgi:hypothetical protein